MRNNYEYILHEYLSCRQTFYAGSCESLIVPTPEGKYGIMANHSNIIIAVIPGALFYRPPGEEMKVAAVSHGIVKVENNKVLVLVDSAECPEDIDANRARRAAEIAREKFCIAKANKNIVLLRDTWHGQ